MDILLKSNGDLYVSPEGDIALENSVAQKIKIKLKWFEGEWKWDQEEDGVRKLCCVHGCRCDQGGGGA